jgi:branched-chain amino acid transport system permease protein
MYACSQLVGQSYVYLAIVPSIAITAFIGLWTYRIVYQPLQKRNASTVILLITSIALLLLFQNILQLMFGPGVKSIEYSKGASLEIAGAVITPLECIIILCSITLFLGLFVVIKQTSLGRNMRAVFDNPELASVVGINVRSIAEYSFFIGSALAGVAGVLISLLYSVTPTMGTNLIIKGFTGAVIGGVANIPASIGGSYLLGLVENYGIAVLPSGYKDAIAFTLLLLFLLMRPEGLFGMNSKRKK